jgi:hypothetical protein
MRLIEWELAEDGYEEQIVIPSEKRKLAAEEGINTENVKRLKENSNPNFRRVKRF